MIIIQFIGFALLVFGVLKFFEIVLSGLNGKTTDAIPMWATVITLAVAFTLLSLK